MMNIISFTFGNHTIRNLIDGKGEPWFALADMGEALLIKDSSDVARRLDDKERADVGVSIATTSSVDWRRQATGINESGLYAISMHCQGATHPASRPHRFRKRIAEVLITKTPRSDEEIAHRLKDLLGDRYMPGWAARNRRLLGGAEPS